MTIEERLGLLVDREVREHTISVQIHGCQAGVLMCWRQLISD